MITVVIADDHHLVRQGIRALLERANDVRVLDEAEDGQQAIRLVEMLAPDILIVDISMPRMSGIQALERIRALVPKTQVIILSMHSDEVLVRQAMKLGASGYLLKRSVTEELHIAVRAAHRGEIYLSPEISRLLVSTEFLSGSGNTPIETLTPREREVLQLIAEGHTNNEIGQLLVISVKTVEKHRSSVMDKLNIHDLAGLVRFAIKQKVISLDG